MATKVSGDKILHLGIKYSNSKGGIASVLKLYSVNFDKFRFYPTTAQKGLVATRLFEMAHFLFFPIKLLVETHIRIIHIHGASNGSFYRKYLYFIMAKRIYRKKIVYHLHGGGFEYFYKQSNRLTKRLIKDFIENSDVLICLSESWKKFFMKAFATPSLYVLNNVIPHPGQKFLRKNNNWLNILFLGKITASKGIYDTIEMIYENKDYFKDTCLFHIAGDGENTRLQNLINKRGVEELVRFYGWVEGEDKDRLLATSDIFLLPSYYEGLPVSVLEAMSYGMAIVSSNVGGIPELLSNNGFMFDPGDKIRLFHAIKTYITDKDILETHKKNSLINVEAFYPEKVFTELDTIYNSLLTENPKQC